MRRLVLVAALAICLVLPGAAVASGTTSSPFSLGVPQATETQTATTPTVATTTTTSGSGGLSTGDLIGIGGGVIVLLVLIAGFVWRDSRRTASQLGHAPSGSGPGTGRHQGSKAPAKPRKLSAAERKRRKRGAAPRRR